MYLWIPHLCWDNLVSRDIFHTKGGGEKTHFWKEKIKILDVSLEFDENIPVCAQQPSAQIQNVFLEPGVHWAFKTIT